MRTRSEQVGIVALTATLWIGYWASATARTGFDGAGGAYLVWLSVTRLVACGLGAGLCLLMGRLLDRWPMRRIGYVLAQAFLVGDLVAIVWALAVRGALFPVARLTAVLAGLDPDVLRPPHPPEHDPIPLVAWLFLAWIGGRYLVRQIVAREAAEARAAYPTELWAGAGKGMTRVAVKDVRWLEAERDYVRLHAADGRGRLIREPMHVLLERLDPGAFVRVHRSAIVNLDHVERIDRRPPKGLEVLMRDGRRVPVGRSYVRAVRAMMAPSAGP